MLIAFFTALLVMSVLALLLGSVLGFSAIKFRVEGNPLVDKIDAVLPQTQCCSGRLLARLGQVPHIQVQL